MGIDGHFFIFYILGFGALTRAGIVQSNLSDLNNILVLLNNYPCRIVSES